jgi:site-specific recombinase XerD
MIEDMTVRNLSPATQRSYIHAVAKFARFFGRSPETLDLEDVRAFQVHLVGGGMSWPALNQTVCALRFLYGVTLRQAELPDRIVYAREPQKLPVVLSTEEVVRFLEAVPSLKCRAALTTAYAAGLRASEVASLKVTNIDSSRMVIHGLPPRRCLPSARRVPSLLWRDRNHPRSRPPQRCASAGRPWT